MPYSLLAGSGWNWSFPSWSCSQAVSKPVWHIPLLCVQWKIPDFGHRNCPKHVEFYSKNKFEKSCIYKVKVEWSRYRRGVTAALEVGDWSAARPGRTLPPGKTRYPLYRRLGGTQGRSGRAENLVPTGIRSRTFQPVVIHYTDWATRPTISASIWFYYKNGDRCREDQNIYFMFSKISEKFAIYDIMWKHMVQSDRPQMTI